MPIKVNLPNFWPILTSTTGGSELGLLLLFTGSLAGAGGLSFWVVMALIDYESMFLLFHVAG
jgi:hypothetical protein